jgi:broad specificity phosphatase PhoE
MATRLTFLCASATASSRSGAFPNPDEPLDDGGLRKTRAFRLHGPEPDLVVTSPSRAAIDTAAATGLPAQIEPAIGDLDYGAWSGRALSDVEALDAPALMNWLADPTGATPGGEEMTALIARVGAWLDRQADSDLVIVAVSHAAVMRAAIAHCLALPAASTLRIDIAPLAVLQFSFHRQWRLQELRRADGISPERPAP